MSETKCIIDLSQDEADCILIVDEQGNVLSLEHPPVPQPVGIKCPMCGVFCPESGPDFCVCGLDLTDPANFPEDAEPLCMVERDAKYLLMRDGVPHEWVEDSSVATLFAGNAVAQRMAQACCGRVVRRDAEACLGASK